MAISGIDMKTKELIFLTLIYLIAGIIIGGLVEHHFQDEPYFIFPVDTVYVYEDTLYIDVYKVLSDSVKWTWENSNYMRLEFYSDYGPMIGDTLRVSVVYSAR